MTLRRTWYGSFALFCAALPLAAQGDLRPTHLYGVASSKALDHVNRNDARAAVKTWFDTVARQRGFAVNSTVDIVDSTEEIEARLRNHSVDLIELCAVEYLELESSRLLVPAAALGFGLQANALYSYVLLVNRSSGIAGLAGLRGKNVLVSSRGGSHTGAAWIEVLLNKEKRGRAETFFGAFKESETAQRCILPVFFGSADACVVDEINLQTASEMNPQLGKLQVIERSRPMIEQLVATPVEPHPYRKELLEAMLTLHENPRGRQLLLILRADRLAPVQPGDLDAARELWKDYGRLTGAGAYRPREAR